jgi:hypothetical protein
VTADEGCHGKVLVRARGRTVNHYQRYTSHNRFSLHRIDTDFHGCYLSVFVRVHPMPLSIIN